MLLDHVLWAVPDLEAGIAQITDVTGVTPSGGGSHPGFGTRNALLSLDDALFFEVIGPDPQQAEFGHRAEAISQLSKPEMHTFCMSADDLDAVASRARAQGVTCPDPVPMSRTREDGVTLNWRILYLEAPEFGPAVPFVIDWQGSPHPAGTSPSGCTMIEFQVLHPRAAALAALFSALEIDVPVCAAPQPGFLLRLETPKGDVMIQ